MEEINWYILEANPLPFMKRYHVYFVDNGKRKWLAKFKYQDDAIHFTNNYV